MRVWRWVVLRCSLEGGMHMHMVLACPTLTPETGTGTPAAPRALDFLLEIVINNAARVAGHGKALASSVREAICILR